jgi:galactokinase
MEKQQLLKAFNETFGKEGESVYFSPGRINLIGEHTDYNGGHVFPCAITLGTYGVYGARTDRKVRLFSENFASLGVIELDLDQLAYRKEDQWTNYVKGMLLYLSEAYGTLAHGFDSYIYGTIPNGAGLSSSASLELLFGVMVNEEFSLHADRLALIKLGKKVENAFIGVNSGIMDQFAVGMGKKNHAILLDCDTLDYDLVPIKMDQYVIVIMNTNKRRELADSKYNERRAECDAALSLIQTKQSVSSLGQLTVEQLEKMADLFESQEVLYRRAAHAVSENQRTLLAKQALEANQLTEFGQLLNASHASLRDDYEVTGKELDTIVAYAQAQPGVLGARMTGAGFGGCAIALVEKDTVDAFIETVGQAYEKAIGYPGAFYVAEIADGTNTMKEEEDKK